MQARIRGGFQSSAVLASRHRNSAARIFNEGLMVKVITVEREYGSQGAEFARLLAEALGWKLIDSCLIDEIARRAGVAKSQVTRCDEQLDPWYHRFGKAFWH